MQEERACHPLLLASGGGDLPPLTVSRPLRYRYSETQPLVFGGLPSFRGPCSGTGFRVS